MLGEERDREKGDAGSSGSMVRCSAKSPTARSTAAKCEAQPNSGGLFLSMSTGCLVEDCILSPGTEVDGGVAGSVLAYNFCDAEAVQGGLLASTMNINHGAHNSFNLYKGNYFPKIQATAITARSHETIFRNWFHATQRQDAVVGLREPEPLLPLLLHRRQRPRAEGVRLEIRGWDGPDSATRSTASIRSAFPNMGNGWCNGKTVQPSKGKHWADWDPVDGTSIKGAADGSAIPWARSPSVPGALAVEQARMIEGGGAAKWAVVRKVEGKVATVDASPWGTKLPR